MKGRAAVALIAKLAIARFANSRMPWICGLVAALPIVFAAALRSHAAVAARCFQMEQLVLVVLPAIVVAGSIAADLDSRAVTYLWSRPLARWSILVGKLVALVPVVISLVVSSWLVVSVVGLRALPSFVEVGAFAFGALAVSSVAGAIPIRSPRYGVVLTILVMLCDGLIGGLPARAQLLSITHDVAVLGGALDGSQAIAASALALLSCMWLVLGLRRIVRLER